MSNFPKELQAATTEELYKWTNEFDFRVVPLASDELTRRSLKEMIETISIFNEKSSQETKKMISLTKWIMRLTIVMTIGLIIQIILAF